METALCLLMTASLTVQPDSLQLFKYQSFSLSCDAQDSSSGWAVWRRNSSGGVSRCSSDWGVTNASFCQMEDLLPLDSGQYWCQSETERCSAVVNITVADGPVILEIPSRPATEGDNVILRCTTQEDLTSDPSADFYKDGALVGTEPTREMTLHGVSAGDEGLYGCRVSGLGESPQSWVGVKARLPRTSHFLLTPRGLPVVGAGLLLVLLLLVLIYWRRHKADSTGTGNSGQQDTGELMYANIIINHGKQPRIKRGESPEELLYSTVKLRSSPEATA